MAQSIAARKPRKRTNGRRRPKGEGALAYNEKRKRWVGRLWIDQSGGTRKRVAVYGVTEEEARDKMADLRRNARHGVVPESRLTVDRFLHRWLQGEKSRVRPASLLVRQSHVRNHISPALGRKLLTKLEPGDVEGLTTGMIHRGLSARTASAVRGTLALALKQAEREGKVMRNAAALARPPKVERAEVEVLDADGIRHLLGSTEGSRWHPLWTLLATSGLRIGEALALTWANLDLGPQGGLVRVRGTLTLVSTSKWAVGPPKTKRAKRDVPIPAPTVQVLWAWRDRQNSERDALRRDYQPSSDHETPVFTDALGKRTNPLAADRAFRRAVKAAELPRCTPHSLRHSYATQLLEAGVPLIVVSRALGHSSIAVTADTYSHLTATQVEQASEVMGKLLLSRS